MSTTLLTLDSIRIDGGTQPREAIDEHLVAEYRDQLTDGATFPPVVVFHDGVAYWLADGFHRVHAARRVGLLEIEAEVRTGTQREAVLFSVGANATHGQRRTNADKRKAVLTLLNDPEWSKWSDSEIARRCAVSHTYVGGLRASLATVASDADDRRTYTDKHGNVTTMQTARIGKSPRSVVEPETTVVEDEPHAGLRLRLRRVPADVLIERAVRMLEGAYMGVVSINTIEFNSSPRAAELRAAYDNAVQDLVRAGRKLKEAKRSTTDGTEVVQ